MQWKKIVMLFIVVVSLAVASFSIVDTGGARIEGSTSFGETFNNIDDWYLVVYNSAGGSANDSEPRLDSTMGLPAPSLDVNGDSWNGNGAYSKTTFDYTKGLTIEFDMYVASGYDWNWGRSGLADHLPNLNNQREDGAYVDSTRGGTTHVARISFTDDGKYNQQPPYLSFSIRSENGTKEIYEYDSDASEYQNEWHSYEIEILENGYVKFYMDDDFKWKSTKKVDKSLSPVPLLFGDRDANGPVRIDNVIVKRGVAGGIIQLPFTDGFEDIADGDYPDENGWQNMYSGYDSAVTTEETYSGAKSFKLQGHSAWSRTDYVLIDTPDYLVYEASVYLANASKGANVGFAVAEGAYNPRFNYVGFRNQELFFQGAERYVLQSYSAGQWYSVKVSLDFLTEKANVYIDGELMGEYLSIKPKEFQDSQWGHIILQNFSLHTTNFDGSSHSTVYFDDVKIAGREAADIYVDKDAEPGWYDATHVRTIQEGIDNATAGDTVFVYNGTYYENVVVNKKVDLVSESRNGTVIDGGGNGTVMNITADMVNLSEFTIRNSSSSWINAGILLYYVDHCNIYDSICENNAHGFYSGFSSNNTISNSICTNNSYSGIALWESPHNTLSNNRMVNNSYNFNIGGNSFSSYIQNIDISNKVNGKPIYYLIHKKDKIIDSSTHAGFVGVINSTNVTIKDLKLTKNIGGILFVNTNNSKIHNVSVSNNGAGGIHLSNSSNNVLSGNRVFGNDGHGIGMYDYSSNNCVMNSYISDNAKNGLRLWDSFHNRIFNTNISNNEIGMYLYSSTENNISKCDFLNNSRGIHLTHFSSTNSIYHNNFMDNTEQARDECLNYWNNSIIQEGNYWSDFDEPSESAYDNDSDGIIDMPYTIPSGDSQDKYPLAQPWMKIRIESYPQQQSAKPGQSATSSLEIENEGNATKTVTLSYSVIDGNPDGWDVDIEPQTVEVPANFYAYPEVAITPPGDATTGSFLNISITAQGTAATASTWVNTTVAEPIYSVSVEGPSDKQGQPGKNVTYYFTVKNKGDLLDTYGLIADSVWKNTLSTSSLTLSPGGSTLVTATVTIPSEASNGSTSTLTLTAYSQHSSTNDSASVTTTAIVRPLLSIQKHGGVESVYAGEHLIYTLWINNTSNVPATNVTFRERYDNRTMFLEAIPSPTTDNDTWLFDAISPGESRKVTIKVLVNSSLSADTTLSNVASVTCDQGADETCNETTVAKVNHLPEISLTAPADNSTNMEMNVTLSVYVSDEDNDTLQVSFYVANTMAATLTNVANSSYANYTLSNLAHNTSYEWYVVVNDSREAHTSPSWNFKTKNKTPYGTIEGTVKDPDDGAGIEGVDIVLHIDGSTAQSAKSNEKGKYVFRDVSPGSYEIGAWNIDDDAKTLEHSTMTGVTVSAGYTVTQHIEMGGQATCLHFSNVCLNGQDDSIHVDMGEKINCTANFTVWSQPFFSDHKLFVVVGTADNPQIIFEGTPGPYPGFTGNFTFKLSAPSFWKTLHLSGSVIFAESESGAVSAFKTSDHRVEVGAIKTSGIPPVAIGASIGGAVSGLLALFIVATEPGKYKFLALFAPLFTRISKDEALESPVREDIYGYIQEHPGVHYNKIKNELDLSNGVASHHLHMLEKLGMVKSQRSGVQYLLFRPYGVTISEDKEHILTDLQEAIVAVVNTNEGISQKEIAQKLDQKQQTISYNLKVLEDEGMIRWKKEGRTKQYFFVGGDKGISG